MFQGVDVLIGSGSSMDAEKAKQFLEANAIKIRDEKPIVEVVAKNAKGDDDSFCIRLSSYVADTDVIALGAFGDRYQGVRRLRDVTHMKFV